MEREFQKISLRENVQTAIRSFLYEEGFTTCETTPKGLFELVNMISDYAEEGLKLYPEVLITNNFEFFKSIPNREIIIGEDKPIDVDEFKNVIKICAPLAINSWIIFIEIKNNRLKYGIASAELSATSLSIYKQTVGDVGVNIENVTIAYIRNIGQKTVELVGLKKRLVASLTLDNTDDLLSNQIYSLSEIICSKCEDNNKNQVINYFEKTINDAIRNGHGNLIGVVDNSQTALKKNKTKIKRWCLFKRIN